MAVFVFFVVSLYLLWTSISIGAPPSGKARLCSRSEIASSAASLTSERMVIFERRFVDAPCAVLPAGGSRAITTDDLVFVMMTHFRYHETRVASSLRTWAKDCPHFVVASDRADPLYRAITWPFFETRTGYFDAGLKPLFGLAHVMREPALSQKKWYVLVDDDTWINIPLLLDFLSKYNPEYPVMFGHVFDYGAMGPPYEVEPPYLQGGAGEVLSYAAASTLAPLLATDACPYANYSDTTIGRCAWANNVVTVHSSQFSWLAPRTLWGDVNNERSYGWPLMPAHIGDAISFHYVPPDRMDELTEIGNASWRVGKYRALPRSV